MKILITTYHQDTVLTSSEHDIDVESLADLLNKIGNAITSGEITSAEIEREEE